MTDLVLQKMPIKVQKACEPDSFMLDSVFFWILFALKALGVKLSFNQLHLPFSVVISPRPSLHTSIKGEMTWKKKKSSERQLLEVTNVLKILPCLGASSSWYLGLCYEGQRKKKITRKESHVDKGGETGNNEWQ